MREAVSTPWLHGLEPGTKLFSDGARRGYYYHPEGDEAVKARSPLAYTKNPNGSNADAAAMLDTTDAS